MATCPNCGTANVTGKFCGNCGAPVPADQPVAAAQMPQPPRGPQPPQYLQPPVQPPYPQPYPTPAPKSKSSAGLIAAIAGGVVVLGVAGFFLYRALQPSKPPVTPPVNPPVADNTKNTPPANPNPNPTPNPGNYTPTGTKLPKMAVVASGKFDFPYQSYDSFGGNQVVLASTNGDRSQVMVYEFKGGKFQEAVEVDQPYGKVNDVNHGSIYNDGKDYAIVPADKGHIIVPEDGDAEPYDAGGIQHVLIGDFDGDTKTETLVIMPNGTTGYTFNLWRYKADKSGDKLKTATFPVWLSGSQVVSLQGANRSLVLGIDTIKVNGGLPLALYSIDDQLTLTNWANLIVHQAGNEQVTGYAAGNIAGAPTLVVAYDGAPGYLEFFDINTKQPSKSLGLLSASRGRITLPKAGSGYQVMVGYFTQKTNPEVLVMSHEGYWTIYSY